MPSRHPRKTRRTGQDVFARPSPAAVTYDLSVRDQATIRVPPGSSWTSGAHWHEAHTEFLQVLSGRAHVTLDGRDLCVGADVGAIAVPRGVVHEWRRADAADVAVIEGEGRTSDEEDENDGDDDDDDDWAKKAEELVVREWTEPRDGAKEVFFRNLNGLVLDETNSAEREGTSAWRGALLSLDLWNLFWRADNYPVVLGGGGGGWLSGVATKLVMGAAVALGWVMGRPGVYEEYSGR